MLLVLREDAQRTACSDYYAARGCDVDTAGDAAQAAPLLRFRSYDLVVADLPSDELAGLSVRTGAVRVLLTTDNAPAESADKSLIVLTKPQPLEAILALGS